MPVSLENVTKCAVITDGFHDLTGPENAGERYFLGRRDCWLRPGARVDGEPEPLQSLNCCTDPRLRHQLSADTFLSQGPTG